MSVMGAGMPASTMVSGIYGMRQASGRIQAAARGVAEGGLQGLVEPTREMIARNSASLSLPVLPSQTEPLQTMIGESTSISLGPLLGLSQTATSVLTRMPPRRLVDQLIDVALGHVTYTGSAAVVPVGANLVGELLGIA